MTSVVCPHCGGRQLGREGQEDYCLDCGWRGVLASSPTGARFKDPYDQLIEAAEVTLNFVRRRLLAAQSEVERREREERRVTYALGVLLGEVELPLPKKRKGKPWSAERRARHRTLALQRLGKA